MNMLYTLRKTGAQATRPGKSSSAKASLSTLLGKADTQLPHILLLGGNDFLSMRIRMAQAIVRDDLTPSHWSHAVLIIPGRQGTPEAYEIPLFPCWQETVPSSRRKPHLAARNGVCNANLAWYQHNDYPNYALITLHPETSKASQSAIRTSIQRFREGRPECDAPAAMLRWLGYAWGVSDFDNPLLNLCGLPSAIFVEHVLDGMGLNITPQVQSASSTPEALWQGVRYWQREGSADLVSRIGHRLDNL